MSTVLIIGSGGREHAIAHALSQTSSKPDLLIAPGNYGTAQLGENIDIAATDVSGLVRLAEARGVSLVVVGPEAPLVAGLADALRKKDIPVLGPDQAAARLEGSKAFAKEIMAAGNIPTALWRKCDSQEMAIEFARSLKGKVAVKADGLAGGKGVIVCDDVASAASAIKTLWSQHGELLVEEKLEGEELSVIALVDGVNIALLAPSQDHKRIGEGDTGPNTGGMGAYAPAPKGTSALLEQVQRDCLQPVIDVFRERDIRFQGFLYAGLMLTADGPKVLEYNVRLGDPETQVILPLLAEDAYELFLAAATGQLKPGPVQLKPGAAVTVVLAAHGYPAKPRLGDEIQGLKSIDDPETMIFHAGTRADGDKILTSGGRVLAVSAIDENLQKAVTRAYDEVAKISWSGMQFRRDIAHRALSGSAES
jgi:phosphoribosylamine---glycine ligase